MSDPRTAETAFTIADAIAYLRTDQSDLHDRLCADIIELLARRDCQRNMNLNQFAADCHAANAQWWTDPRTGERIERNKGELLMLIVSEVAECMEGERKDLMDTHLPHRKMAEVELADVLIRVFDYAGAFGYDLDGAVSEKHIYNARRADHKAEARLRADGKKW